MKYIVTYFFLIASLVFSSCNAQKKIVPVDYDNPYLFNSEIQKKVREDTLSWKYQISSGEYALKGNFHNALRDWSKAFGGADRNFSQSEIDSIHNNYKTVSAKEYIVEQARKYQVIIINEAHNYSSHRVFVTSLLKDLYNEGYTNLGIEALTNGDKRDTLLNTRKYAVLESGYYIKDPNFGKLVRTALKTGYHIFAYEQTGDLNGKEREIAQARNIQKAMQQKPNEKFLIYCGFDHSMEGEHRKWEKAMAGRLKELTGIDPLTINQVKYSERYNRNFNRPLLKALQINTPSVLLDTNNKPLEYIKSNGWSDIAILHPNTRYKKGRPLWLFTGKKKLVKFQNKILPIDYPIMALAFKKHENFQQAVPVDIIELEDKSDNSYFVLDKGTYNVIVTNKKKKSLKYEIEVK